MHWQDFVLNLIKELGNFLSSPGALAILTWLIGVHQPQPKYMKKKDDEEQK